VNVSPPGGTSCGDHAAALTEDGQWCWWHARYAPRLSPRDRVWAGLGGDPFRERAAWAASHRGWYELTPRRLEGLAPWGDLDPYQGVDRWPELDDQTREDLQALLAEAPA
jgi:hypothetical protein